jgi:hypothetical protein
MTVGIAAYDFFAARGVGHLCHGGRGRHIPRGGRDRHERSWVKLPRVPVDPERRQPPRPVAHAGHVWDSVRKAAPVLGADYVSLRLVEEHSFGPVFHALNRIEGTPGRRGRW